MGTRASRWRHTGESRLISGPDLCQIHAPALSGDISRPTSNRYALERDVSANFLGRRADVHATEITNID